MEGLDYFGAEEALGFDYGALLQTAGALAEGGIAASESAKAEAKSSADTAKQLSDAINADLAAVTASANAAVSNQRKSPKAPADIVAAQKALDAVGKFDLDPDSQSKRQAAAQKASSDAQTRSAAKPKDGYLKAVAGAWAVVLDKIQGGGEKKGKGDGEKEPWLQRRIIGPLPGYAVLVGGIGILGALGFAVKKVFFPSK